MVNSTVISDRATQPILWAALASRQTTGWEAFAMLISSVAYQNGRKVADIEPQDIHRYLVQPETFVWVALLDPDDRALELMQAEFNLHPLAVEDARHGHQRPKIEEYGEVLFVVLHMIELESDGELRVGEVAIFVGR